jgi:xanthine dehydrogenase accessory factor
MRELLATLSENLKTGQPVAWCRLVETRGSTPQKAGALMLVYPNGSQAGTLGGGCVEAEVKRQALARLHDRRSEIATFQLDSDYGWDDGLICGGRMRVLLVPLVEPEPGSRRYFLEQAQRAAAGEGITEAISLDRASGDLAAPSMHLFDHAGEPIASIGGNADELAIVRERLRPLSERPRPYVAAGMAYLPVLPRCRLLIVGGGHVGKAVASLAAQLEFDVWVVDDRAEVVSADRFPDAERRIVGEIGPVLRDLEITSDTYCLIVTRGHNHDEEALYHLAGRRARYVGMIGSRRKIKLIFEDLLDKGISHEALQKVHAPLGIDIGSQTVPEIAVSICAELVAHRNRGIVPGRPDAISFGTETVRSD